MYPPSIQKIIDHFSKFPTVGPRTAARFVFYLLNSPQKEIQELIQSISELKNIKLCNFCFNPFEGNEGELCPICSNPTRDRTLLCIVEKETDLMSIEKTRKYNGLYFILGGNVSKLKKEDIEKLRIKELKQRILSPRKFGILDSKFKEVIIATNPTTEGQTTLFYLARVLKPLKIKITGLGRGLPLGGELEYADEETLGFALDNRK